MIRFQSKDRIKSQTASNAIQIAIYRWWLALFVCRCRLVLCGCVRVAVFTILPHTSKLLELIERTRQKSVYYYYERYYFVAEVARLHQTKLSKHLNINGAKTFTSLLLLLSTVIEIRIFARDRFVLLVDTSGPLIPLWACYSIRQAAHFFLLHWKLPYFVGFFFAVSKTWKLATFRAWKSKDESKVGEEEEIREIRVLFLSSHPPSSF